ncbi:P-loop containing nucleoside triphosphate hydrolase protein [Chytridium lagenaria]|nr:P-loop containing nucleoside triphosphate hydrolase protein [Chytridium lagenaria]
MEEDAPKQAAQFVNGKLVNKGLDATIAKLSQLSLEVRKVLGNDVSQAINFIFDKTKSGATTDAKSDVSPFQFNSPSPDDIVFNARSAKDKGKTTAIKSKPISSEPAVATKPKETVTFVAPKPRPAKEARIDIEAEMKARSHVDAGKSTIMGHLLFLLGEVDGRTMQKYERDAEKMKKSSFAFAWVLDATERRTVQVRYSGVTIDVAISKFETPSRKFTLLDAPGHRDFVPNMISGAAQADVALLVVDSTTGEFETGFDAGGQTREHALLCNWEESRFLEIQQKLQNFLVTFVPCSGFTGKIFRRDKSALLEKWYTGKTLVEVLGGLSVGSSGKRVLQGRIESGVVKVGDQIFIMPLGEECTPLRFLDDPVKWWQQLETYVSLSIAGVDLNQICVGNILCEKARPIPVTSHFRAKIVTFDIKIPLVSTLDRSTGDVVKEKSKPSQRTRTAVVEIKLDRPICIETSKDSKELGHTVVAAGIVSDIISRTK